jgi:hypothetical protein
MAVTRTGIANAPLAGEVESIRDGCIRLRGGRLRAVIRTGELNLLEASREETSRYHRAFIDLLNSLTAPLQIWFHSTRVSDVPPSAVRNDGGLSDRAGAWRAETDDFLRGQLETQPVYQRRVHLVIQPHPEVIAPPGRGFVERLVRRGSGRGYDGLRTPDEAQSADLERQAGILIGQLGRLGVDARRLSSVELEELVARLGGEEAGWEQTPGWFRASARYYRAFHLFGFPGGDLEPGWLAPLLSHPTEMQVSIHISPVESDHIIGYLSSRIRDLRAAEMVERETGVVDLTTEALPDAVALRSTLARNEEKAFMLGVYAAVSAPTVPELRLRCEALHSVFTRLLVRPAPTFLRQREAMKTVWPLGQDLLGKNRLVHTTGVATLFPWLNADLFYPGDQYWGRNQRSGGIVACDPFRPELFSNANIAIFGHSGAGKTFAASTIVLSSFAAGVGSVIFDPEYEYAGLCRSLAGTYVEVGAGSSHAINVLDPALRPGDGAQDTSGDVLDLVAVLCGRLDEVERALVHAALQRLLRHRRKQPPLLGDLHRLVTLDPRLSRVSTVLERWVNGELGRFFNRQTNVNLQNPVVGIGLRDLQEELVAPAYFLIASWVWAQLRRVRQARHLLVDEAGLLFEHPVIRKFLVRLARRIRKYDGSLLIATQNASDLVSTPEGLVLATNPAILLLGHQRSGEAQRLAHVFALTDRQADALHNARRGEFLMLAGSARVALRIDPPRWQHDLILSSKGSQKEG